MRTDDEKLPKSRIIHVAFELALPASATKAQIEEWVRFNLHASSMATASPLHDYDIEMVGEPLLTDTQTHLYSETERMPDGSHVIRRWKSPYPYDGPDPMEEIAATSQKPR